MVFDHTSVLKLIEWRWGLDPLTARDASNDINNLACVLNFTSPDATVPVLPQPAMPEPVPCLSDPGGLTD
jgi:phospholipase C